MICTICPHLCDLAVGETGKCLVRKHEDWTIVCSHWGKVSLLTVEPIEKRPFFHFMPGSRFLSVGLYGCNFQCKFCQNYKISQIVTGNCRQLEPDQLIDVLYEKKAAGIAFTFNEPTVHVEYIMDVGERVSPVVVKTNGFVNIEPLKDLLLYVSAFNVDIKGDEQEYEDTCGGRLKPVMETVEFLASNHDGVHLEISYLVTPRLIDDVDYHRRMRDWLSELSPDIPIHVLYFYPFHRMTEKDYKVEALLKVVELFREKMNFVYVSNNYQKPVLPMRDTLCPHCSSVLISRQKGVKVHKTKCCGNSLAGLCD